MGEYIEYPFVVDFVPGTRENAELIRGFAATWSIHCEVIDPKDWFVTYVNSESARKLLSAVSEVTELVAEGDGREALEALRERLDSWVTWRDSQVIG